MDLKNRERKVDVNSLPAEQVDVLSQQIGDKVRSICDEAAEKVNAILSIYGMSAKIAIAFNELPKSMQKNFKTPKKRGRKPKQANLKDSAGNPKNIG